MTDRVRNTYRRSRHIYFLVVIYVFLFLVGECKASAIYDSSTPITRRLQDGESGDVEISTNSSSNKEETIKEVDDKSADEDQTKKSSASSLSEESQRPSATPVKGEVEEPVSVPVIAPVPVVIIAPIAKPVSENDETSTEIVPPTSKEAEVPNESPMTQQELDTGSQEIDKPTVNETKATEENLESDESSDPCTKHEKKGKCNKEESCTWDKDTDTCIAKDEKDDKTKEIEDAPTTGLPTTSPTEPPTTPPTGSPTSLPTKPPITDKSSGEIKSTTKDDNDDDEKCSIANGCKSCIDLAPVIEGETGSKITCRWKDNKCNTIKKSDVAVYKADDCPEAKDDAKPNEEKLETDEEDNFLSSLPPHFVYGTAVIIVCCVIAIRRFRTRKTNNISYGRVGNNFYPSTFPPSNHISTAVKYEGVKTVPDDDDPEWDWPQRNDTSSGGNNRSSSGGNPRHRGSSSSPPFGSYNSNHSNVSSGNSASFPMDVHVSPRTEKTGFSVKKSGMKNPLNNSNNVSKEAILPNRVNNNNTTGPSVRKPTPPSANDFFAEMGLDSKPKFGPSSSVAPAKKRLGAVALPIDTSKDTWGDDDLDDLLD